MKKLLKYLKGHALATTVAPIFKLLEATFELIIPLVVAKIIDVGIPSGDVSYILIACGILVALGIFGLGFSLSAQWLAAKVSLGFGTNVRGALFSHIQKLDTQTISKHTPESLVTRLTSDTVAVQNGVSLFLRLVLRAPFIAIGACILAVLIDARLSVIFLLMAALIGIVLIVISLITSPRYRKIQSQLDNVSALSRSSLNGNRVIRAYNKQEKTEKQFFNATQKLEKLSISTTAISALINPLTFAIINLAVIAVLYFGGQTVYYGNLTQGEIVALVNYLTQILHALVVIATLIIAVTKATTSAKRISEIMDLPISLSSVNDKPQVELDESAPAIEFKNVSFSYKFESAPVISNVDFCGYKGETIGIIGSTASGKSTIANLAVRLFSPSSGQIQVFGHDIADYPDNFLKSITGYVQQKALLFSGTLRENMLLGDVKYSDSEIISALRAANADFAEKLTLDHVLLEGGKNLSGGQKQRLTIARALIKKPRLLVLDDACSALDFATEAEVKRSIAALTDTCVLTISQRISSVMTANKILVLDAGKVAGVGTHKELLATCDVYKSIYESQL